VTPPTPSCSNTCNSPSHWSLTVLGVVLVVWGIWPYVASFLYYLAKIASSPLEPIGVVELLISVVLLGVIPMRIVRRIPKATRWAIIGIGLLVYTIWYWKLVAWTLEIRILHHIAWSLGYFELDDRATIGLMITTLGVILVGSNGNWLWILQRLWKTGSAVASWSRAHVKVVLMVSLIGLWLVNPYNSHETCIQVSNIAENHGAYQTAIFFTELARDTFPTTTGCYTCFMEVHAYLTERMIYLELKNAGKKTEFESTRRGDCSGNEKKLVPSWKAMRNAGQ
jgi:hypothetical protein